MSKKKRATDNIVKLANARASMPEWLTQCMRNSKGAPVANLANIRTALRGEPLLKDCFAFDAMLQAPILMRPLPGMRADGFEQRPLTDVDVSNVQDWLQHQGLPNIGRDATHQAVLSRADECTFHPVLDYLKALQWDGKARIGTWLSIYLGAADTNYTQNVGSMFLISMVARIFKPGAKVDYMLVLEGGQGELKSTTCKILAGEWFSDTLPSINEGKDVYQHLPGKWLIEIPEMHATHSKQIDAAHLKAFLSGTVDKYRPSHGRLEVVRKRQCVFVGTTNKSDYLRDETGNRRFWPVATTAIDDKALEQDRDQLFAEAVVEYLKGTPWWPTKTFERDTIAPEQEARYEEDIWEGQLKIFLENDTQTTIDKCARLGLGLVTEHIDSGKTRRIAKCLAHMQWERARTKRERYWVRKNGGT